MEMNVKELAEDANQTSDELKKKNEERTGDEC